MNTTRNDRFTAGFYIGVFAFVAGVVICAAITNSPSEKPVVETKSDELEKQLKAAVAKENYELAAKLRDRIKLLAE